MNITVVVLLSALSGALSRTLVPFLQELQQNPDTVFDRKFLVPPAVACVVAVLTLPLAIAALPKELLDLTSVSLSGVVAIFVAVWGATDIARAGQKLLGSFIK